jgi:hypothetical protein
MTPERIPSEVLAAFADGELDERRRRDVEAAAETSESVRREVASVVAMRQGLHRTLERTTVPMGLRERIVARLPVTPAARTRLRIPKGPLLAAAALVLLVFLLRPLLPGGEALIGPASEAPTAVAAAAVIDLHNRCADRQPHDPLGVRRRPPAEIVNVVQARVAYGFIAPDFRDYALDGVCFCPPVDGVELVHMYYRPRTGNGPPLSIFSSPKPLKLADRVSSDFGACFCEGCQATQVDGATVVLWSIGKSSFLACADLPIETLRLIVEQARSASVIKQGSVRR